MKPISIAKLASTAVVLMIPTTQGQTHPIAAPLSAYEIVLAVEGKTCASKAGAMFTFANDRHYAYDGLWRNGGHYRIEDGAVIVTFYSGLERSFSVSRKRGVLHMETTPLSCDTKVARGGSGQQTMEAGGLASSLPGSQQQ